MIELVNGPWSNHMITDSGTVEIKMEISKKWKGNRPAEGAESGYAIYEPSADRKTAFWLRNVWEGITLKVIEA